MNDNTIAVLERLTAASLEKCLLRLSRVSAGTWQILGINISTGTAAGAIKQHDFTNQAAAVYFNLGSGPALTMIMLFDPTEIEGISKGFTGHSFPRGERTTPAEEITLMELGNIVMNALANSVLNALNKTSFPALPEYIEGDSDALIKELGAITDLNREYRVIKATLAIRCDNNVANSEVFALIPLELASILERATPPQ